MSGTAGKSGRSGVDGAIEVTDGSGPLTVDGTVNIGTMPNVQLVEPVSVDDNGGSLTVDGTVAVSNFPAVQPVSDNGGSLSVDDGGGSLTVDGAVSITWPVTVSGNTGGSNTGSVIVTRLSGAFPAATAQRLTSALARRVTILWENSSAAVASRPTLNGVPLFQQSSQGGAGIIIGDLRAPGTVPVLDIRTNLATDDLTIVEEL